MMASLQRRLAALEAAHGANASRADPSLRVVIAQPGETADQARHRLGIASDAKGVLLVVFGVAPKRED